MLGAKNKEEYNPDKIPNIIGKANSVNALTPIITNIEMVNSVVREEKIIRVKLWVTDKSTSSPE